MQRYFVEYIDNNIVFDADDVHHIKNVMRSHIGDKIEVVFSKKLFIAEIASLNPLSINLVSELSVDCELEKDVTLFFALSKGDKNEFVIQKATELGAKRIVLLETSRCVVHYDQKDIAKKLTRFQKIAKEASEQSHRLIVPEVVGVYNIKNIPSTLLADKNYVAYELEAGKTQKTFSDLSFNSYSVLIGPEGGLSENEVQLLEKIGFERISLGKRILRCETAATYALSVLSYLLEK
jgi:16S rRNA (uracil1498-N3)-methyltransferase